MNTSILFSEKQIQEKITELAQQINKTYGKEEVLAIGILKGAFMFYTKLLRQLDMELTCDFCSVSFYGGSKSASKEAVLSLDVKSSVQGKKILLVDCIADQGLSIDYVKKHLQQREPHSIKTTALLVKPMALKKTTIDFKGFEVDQSAFVVGYGVDYGDEGRNFRYFAQLNDLN